MLNEIKGSGDYLGQISNNIEEKTAIIDTSLSEGSLPRDQKGLRTIVELGTGGGESLRKMKSKIESLEGTHLFALDIIPSLAASLKKETGIEAVAADAGNLPFANESVSAINASAVLHEVSSYGTDDQRESRKDQKIYGKEAVIQTLGELNRVLLPDGLVAYRDVLAPIEGLDTVKTVHYSKESWKLFTKWFLPEFLSSPTGFYKNSTIDQTDTAEGFTLSAPQGLQRELQRHYIMFRDYLRTVKNVEFGLTFLRSDWLQEEEGLKMITFFVSPHVERSVDLSSLESHDSATGKVYRADSDVIDTLYDQLIELSFKEKDNTSEQGRNFDALIEGWKTREGSEYYLYGNFANILNYSIEASNHAKSDYVLFPKSIEDVRIAPRYYYNRYLKSVIDNPEQDGKQIIALRKMSRAVAQEALENLESAPDSSHFFDSQTLPDLNTKISVGP